jgi:hypothetical protein
VAVELLGKELGVLSTDLEGQLAADVAEHGGHCGLVHLGQVLVGDRERQAVPFHVASLSIVANGSVAEFWNSSTYRWKSRRWCSATSARLMRPVAGR